jgi:hypothetical protein
VGTSGLASCCSKYMTMFMQPMKLATCSGVRPDWKNNTFMSGRRGANINETRVLQGKAILFVS